MKRKLKLYMARWKYYGPPVLAIITFIVFIGGAFGYNVDYVFGSIMLMWLTLPCSFATVNNNTFLWVLRQTLFLFCALTFFGIP